MNTLPYDLARLVWVYIDYETLKPLCALSRINDPIPMSPWALIRDLTDDPSVWVEKLNVMDNIKGVTLSNFWKRSVVEQELPLPEPRAQMRYVEILSRRGVVSDSIYFLPERTIWERGYKCRRPDLVNKYDHIVRKEEGEQRYAYLAHRPTESSFSGLLEGLDQPNVKKQNYFEDLIRQSIKHGDSCAFLKIMEKGISLRLNTQSPLYFHHYIGLTTNIEIIQTMYELYQIRFDTSLNQYFISIMFINGRFDFFPVIEQLIRNATGKPDGPFVNCLDDEMWEVILGDGWFQDMYCLESLEHLLSWGLSPDFIKEKSNHSEGDQCISRAVKQWLK